MDLNSIIILSLSHLFMNTGAIFLSRYFVSNVIFIFKNIIRFLQTFKVRQFLKFIQIEDNNFR